MAKISTYLFWILISTLLSTVIIQLFSNTDTTEFYALMNTIIKLTLGAWGGAAISESNKKVRRKRKK